MATAMKNQWCEFSKPSTDRKLGLKVDAHIFWVSREKLAEKSPVFNAMLFGEFQEAKNDVVELKDKDPDSILELLRCLFEFHGKTKKIDRVNLDTILQLADEYQIESLLKQCSEFIKTNIMPDPNQVSRGFKIAFRYNFGDVVRYGIKRCSKVAISDLLPCLSEFPMEIRYLITLSIAGQMPKKHDIVDVYLRHDEHSDDSDNNDYEFCSVCPEHMGPDEARTCCKYCDFGLCYRCVEPEDAVCTVCHTCREELGSTEFCCDCVDAVINSELEKLGF